ncbi:MAG: putative baseplate assembly protein [Geminicoccaceae bacterium]
MAALDACGCCDPGEPATPQTITNRPGLSAVAYRVGTFASFRETMLERLAGDLPELTTRSTDDHAITLLELWAAACDVLTFYQERIANEAFLRTAVHRDSVRMLAGLLDYRPRPGLSSEVDIAFALDEGAALRIRPGVRLMSLPGADEQPQTFETLEACDADAALNRLQARPVPVMDTPLAAGRASLLVESGAEQLNSGDRLVILTATALEERGVTGVTVEDGAHRVTLDAALTQDLGGGVVRRVVRPLRFFGWNAPDRYQAYDPGHYDNVGKKWNPPPLWKTVDISAEAGLPLGAGTLGDAFRWPLEARISGLAVGSRIVVVHDGKVEVGRVTSIVERPETLGPLTDTVTVVTLAGVTNVVDRRRARLFEVTGTPVLPRAHTYPTSVTGGRVTLRPAPATAILPKRRILLKATDGTVHAATVTGSEPQGGGADHLAVDFTPALPAPLAADGLVLFGNVERAGHGETQMEENLGDGDGAKPFQSFVLSKAPVTRRPSAKDVLGVAALDILVDGVRWTEVASLYGQAADARVYTLLEEEDGKTRVLFGDGRTGARLPSGRGNVLARYRKGLGEAANVEGGQLSILLSRPPGLRDAQNPAAAESGTDPDPIEDARKNAPSSVRTFGRIVAIEDFAWLATTSGEIAKAKATWIWRGLDRVVHLTVAAHGGGDLSATALHRLQASLDAARDPNHVLLMANALRVPVRVEAKLVVGADREHDVVLAAARAALLDGLSFERTELGHALDASRVIAALQGVAGVLGVDLDVLQFRDATTWTAVQLAARSATTRPDQPHLRIFDARPPKQALNDPPAAAVLAGGAEVVPAEIATLADADLKLTASGGIA